MSEQAAPRDMEDREMRDRLRGLRVDLPADEFQASLRRRLLAAGPPTPPPFWRRVWPAPDGGRKLLWPMAGVAAGALVFLGLSWVQDHHRLPWIAPPGYATLLPATKVAVVRLNLSAEVAVERARIRVTLPPDLAFWVDGQELGQRAFEWTQPLRTGDNEIAIAVRGQRPGRYRVSVSARVGDERIEDEIFLEVVDG